MTKTQIQEQIERLNRALAELSDVTGTGPADDYKMGKVEGLIVATIGSLEAIAAKLNK